MKTPETQGQDSKSRLQELEKAIDQLQEKLESLGRSLKEIKNAIDKPNDDQEGPRSRNECVALPYLFVS